MADVTISECVTNGSAELELYDGSSSQTFDISRDERTCLLLINDGASTLSATVSTGTGISSVMGDLAVEVPAGKKKIVGPLESARFKSISTGKVTVELSATASVSVAAIQL
jgi:hypothetical protein